MLGHPRLAFVMVAFALAAAPLALTPVVAAPGKEKVKLARKNAKGDRLLVKERSRTETSVHWKGEGEGSVGGQELETVEREFSQEILKTDPLTAKREYRTSLRRKGKPKDDSVEPLRTSIHGKTILVTPDGPHLEGGEISKEDRESLDTIERIAYSLLPPEEVATGDTWKVSDEVGKAVFRGIYDPENFKTQGTGKLESLKTVEGRRAAKLALRVAILVKPTEMLPKIELELKGTALFLVDEGVFAELKLEGPLRYEQKKDKHTSSAEGVMVYELTAQVLAGAPAPPPPTAAAKDEDLARAKVVECSKGHKFPNEFHFCGQCGRAIGAEKRRCEGGCPPLLRFCPLCGEPLVPAK